MKVDRGITRAEILTYEMIEEICIIDEDGYHPRKGMERSFEAIMICADNINTETRALRGMIPDEIDEIVI